jgi:hypothetical protein
MLRASWRICLRLCERGFAGSGRKASTRRQTTASGGPEGAAGFLMLCAMIEAYYQKKLLLSIS